MLTPKGNVSTKKAPGMQWKRYMRVERIARLDLAGFTETEIAFSQGITVVRVNQLKRTPEYVAIRLQCATGIIAQADRNMFADIDANHQVIKDMVPEALLALRDTILDRNNPALRLRAAQDLLDREGTLAKVSRTEVKAHIEYDFTQHEGVANSLLDALQQTEAGRSTNNNENNIIDLKDLGINDFSSAGLGKESQRNLQQALDLINNFTVTEPGTTVN